MEDFTLVWHDEKLHKPNARNDVLVITEQGYFAIATVLQDFDGWGWEGGYTWLIKIDIGDYDVWDDDVHGKIAYWAELPVIR